LRVPVFDLQVGDSLTRDVYNANGLHLISGGTVLDSQDIGKLKKHHIDFVDIVRRPIKTLGFDESKEIQQDEVVLVGNLNNFELPDSLSSFTVIAFQESIFGIKDLFEQAVLHDRISMSGVNASYLPLITNVKQEKDVVALLLSLSSNDDYTFQHSVQVGIISYFLAVWMGKSEEEAKLIGKAGFLHDIGKSKISQDILLKPDKLTKAEFAEMVKHTQYGYEIIKRSIGSEDLAAAALQHHERLNGSGYPDRRKADEIHPYAKIVAVADIYSAMISHRVYQQKRDLLYVLKELFRMSFGELDPYVVHIFIKNMIPNFIGKKVTLVNGQSGTIVLTNPTDFFRPLIQIDDKFIDLAQKRDLEILTVYMS